MNATEYPVRYGVNAIVGEYILRDSQRMEIMHHVKTSLGADLGRQLALRPDLFRTVKDHTCFRETVYMEAYVLSPQVYSKLQLAESRAYDLSADLAVARSVVALRDERIKRLGAELADLKAALRQLGREP